MEPDPEAEEVAGNDGRATLVESSVKEKDRA
jgi:hypothetical protein